MTEDTLNNKTPWQDLTQAKFMEVQVIQAKFLALMKGTTLLCL